MTLRDHQTQQLCVTNALYSYMGRFRKAMTKCMISLSVTTGCFAFYGLFAVWDQYRHDSCPDPNYPDLVYGDNINSCYGNGGHISTVKVQTDAAFTILMVTLGLIGGCIVTGLCYYYMVHDDQNRNYSSNSVDDTVTNSGVSGITVLESNTTIELESIQVISSEDSMNNHILIQEQSSDAV